MRRGISSHLTTPGLKSGIKIISLVFIIFTIFNFPIGKGYSISPPKSYSPDMIYLIKEALKSSYPMKISNQEIKHSQRKYKRGKIEKLELERIKVLKQKRKFNLIQNILECYFEVLKLSDQIRIQKLKQKLYSEEISYFKAKGSLSPEYVKKINNQIELIKLTINKMKKEREQAVYKLKLYLDYPQHYQLETKKDYSELIRFISKIYKLVDIPEWGFEYRLNQIDKELAKKNVGSYNNQILAQMKAYKLKHQRFNKKIEQKICYVSLYYYNLMQDVVNKIITKAERMLDEALLPDQFGKARQDYIQAIYWANDIKWKLLKIKLDLISMGKESKKKVSLPEMADLLPLKRAVKLALHNSLSIKLAKLRIKASQERRIPSPLVKFANTELEYKKYRREKLKQEVAGETVLRWYKVLLASERLDIAKRLLKISNQEIEFYKNREEFGKFQLQNAKLKFLRQTYILHQRLLNKIMAWLELVKRMGKRVNIKDLDYKEKNLYSITKIEEQVSKTYQFHPQLERKLNHLEQNMAQQALSVIREGFWVIPSFYKDKILGPILKNLGLSQPGLYKELGLFQALRLSKQDKDIATRIQSVILNKIDKSNHFETISLANQAILTEKNLEHSKRWMKSCLDRVEQVKQEKRKLLKKIPQLIYDERDLIEKTRKVLQIKDGYNQDLIQYLEDLVQSLEVPLNPRPARISQTKAQLPKRVVHLTDFSKPYHYPKIEIVNSQVEALQEILNTVPRKYRLIRKQLPYVLEQAKLKTKIKFLDLKTKLQIAKFYKLELERFSSLIDNLFTFMKKQYQFGIIDPYQIEEVKDIKFQVQQKLYQIRRKYRNAWFGIKGLLGLDKDADLDLNSISKILEVPKITVKDMDRFIQAGINNDPELNIFYLKMGYLGLGVLSNIRLSSGLRKYVETDSTMLKIRQSIKDLKAKLYLLYTSLKSHLNSLTLSHTRLLRNINVLNQSLEGYKKRTLSWGGEYGVKDSIINFIASLEDYFYQLERYNTDQKKLLQLLKAYHLWPNQVRIETVKLNIPSIKFIEKDIERIHFIKQSLVFFPGSIFMNVNFLNLWDKSKSLLKSITYKIKDFSNKIFSLLQKLFMRVKSNLMLTSDIEVAREKQKNYWRRKARERIETAWERRKQRQTKVVRAKKIKKIFEEAEQKEYEASLYLDKRFKKIRKQMKDLKDTFKQYRRKLNSKNLYKDNKIKKLIEILRISFPFYYKGEIVITRDDLETILFNLLHNYGVRLKLDPFQERELIDNLLLVGGELNSFLDNNELDLNIPDFWSEYVQNLVSKQVNEILIQNLDFNWLGLLIFYARLISYSKKPGGTLDILRKKYPHRDISKLTKQCIRRRIKQDLKFLKLNLEDMTLKQSKQYLRWMRISKQQLDEVTFSNFNQKQIIQARKTIQSFDIDWLGAMYGDLQARAIQEDIYRWIISMGIDLKDLSKVLNMMNALREEIIKFFPPPTLTEMERNPKQVLIRSLVKEKDFVLLNTNFNLVKQSYILGKLISLSRFGWENKLDLKDITLLFEIMSFLRELESFQDIFGKPSLNAPQVDFYQALLINFAKAGLDKYNQVLLNVPGKSSFEVLTEVKKELVSEFSLMSFLHNLESFKFIYGDYKLIVPQVNAYPEKKINIYLGNLTYHAEWMLRMGFDNKYIKNYFQNLKFLLTTGVKKLKTIYKKLNIEVDLNLNQPTFKLRREVLGIYQSWVSFLSLRGFTTQQKFGQALDELIFIAELNSKYGLNFNQGQLRYWFVKKYSKGYQDKTLTEIFHNMAKVREVFKDASKDLIQELNNIPLADWETEDIRKRIVHNIKLLGKEKITFGEVQRLAEEVMLETGLAYQDLLEEYSLSIFIQASYLSFRNKKLTPIELTKRVSLAKQYGFSKPEIANFIRLIELMSDEERKLLNSLPQRLSDYYPRMTEAERLGFLIDLFQRRQKGYEAWIKKWWNKAEIIQENFYQEHGFFLDFSLLVSLIDFNLMRKRDWQLERIIEKGTLSKESQDIDVINLGKKLNLERNILRWALKSYWGLLDEQGLKSYKEISNYLRKFPVGRQRRILKQTMEKVVSIKMGLIQILLPVLTEEIYQDQSLIRRIDYVTNEISQEFILPILNWVYKHKFEECKVRRKIRLNRQEELIPQRGLKKARPGLSHTLTIPSEREKIRKTLYKKANKTYGVELSPSRISALIWKMREGYSLEQVLNIYIKNYNDIKQIYTDSFNKQNLTAKDHHLILYFSEKLGLNFLAQRNLEEMFDLAYKVKNELKIGLDLDISIKKSLDYGRRLLYSGANKKIIELIINEVKVIKKMIEENFSVKVRFLSEDISIKKGYIDLKKIIYLVSNVRNIEIVTPPLLRIYSPKDYLSAIEKGIKRYNLPHYWNDKEIKFEIADRLRLANLSPAWWIMALEKSNQLNEFILNQLKTSPGIEDLFLYLDSKLTNATQKLNLYQLKPWYVGGWIVKLNLGNTQRMLNKAFKYYLKDRLQR